VKHEKPTADTISCEQALIGAVLLNNEVLEDLPRGLTSGHFSEAAHRRIWLEIERAIIAGRHLDPAGIGGALLDDREFQELGGIRYLADLVVMSPSSQAACRAAEIILARDADVAPCVPS
jgi:replicative DNA helicase